jgi:hypothetical protein
MPLKPLVFVAMPFGKKHSDNVEIDFDQIYNKAIKPAASKCDVEIIRADEERTGELYTARCTNDFFLQRWLLPI